MLALDIAYPCTKFDNSSFSRSRDVVCVHQNLNGSHELTTPLSRMFCHHWAGICYYQPAYQRLSFYLRPPWKYEKELRMCKMGWFEVVRGHPRSLTIAPFDRAHRSSYQHCIVTMFLYCIVTEIQRDIGRKSLILTYPTSIWHPRWGYPVGNSPRFWYQKTRVSDVYGSLRDCGFNCLDWTLTCVTDGRTHDDIIASHGNK